MSRILWKSLLVTPAVFGATLVVSSTAMATPNSTTTEVSQPQTAEAEVPANSVAIAALTKAPEAADAVPVFSTNAAPTEPQQLNAVESVTPNQPLLANKLEEVMAQATPSPASPSNLDQVNRYSNEGRGNVSAAGQVTSVSQLSDVRPTDWAFQALQSLVERYGCIVGYPDGTYRGNRALTRYEFAAGLNACLDRVNELIATATAELVTKEDLATLQRLQEEFAAELATLRGRVDALEARTAELEANQFSTTTKLVGEVVAAVTDEFGTDNDNNTVLQDRVRLDFQTSFTGRDVLHTRLATGNARTFNIADEDDPFGTFEGNQTFNLSPNTNNSISLDWLSYYFPIGNSQVYVAAAGGIHNDYVPTLSPYFQDFGGGGGALSTFASESPIYTIGGGAGGALNLSLGKGGILGASSITLGYLADNANNPNNDFGLFNGDFAALGQINFNFGDRFAIAGTYVHGYHNNGDGIFDYGGSLSSSVNRSTGPVVGTALANNPALLIGNNRPIVSNTYGVEAAFRLSDRISINGWAAYTNAIVLGRGNADIWTYGLGIALPDFGKRGSILGLFAGVEPTLRGASSSLRQGQSFSRDYGFHVEGFYKYQLTDNISVTPGVIWLTAPGQDNDNEDAVIGTLRTTFKF